MPTRGVRHHWRVTLFGLICVIAGSGVGVGSYTFVYANGASYLVDNPSACANCHIMNEQFDAWSKSGHRHVATCNDCHTPHNILGKYFTKALNGYNHSMAFTTGSFPEPIRITPRNLAVTEGACRHCHSEMVEQIDSAHARFDSPQGVSCVRCHSSVGHLH